MSFVAQNLLPFLVLLSMVRAVGASYIEPSSRLVFTGVVVSVALPGVFVSSKSPSKLKSMPSLPTFPL